jgi:hypothetical protein
MTAAMRIKKLTGTIISWKISSRKVSSPKPWAGGKGEKSKKYQGRRASLSPSDICVYLAYKLLPLHRRESQTVSLCIFKMRYEPILSDVLLRK